MKRIYTTLALLGALVTGAYAQTTAYVQAVMLSDSASFNSCSSSDSVYVSYAFINRGAYTIQPADSFGFNDMTFGTSGSGAIGWVTSAKATNDTIFQNSGYILRGDLGWALTSDGSGNIIELDTTQIVNGAYLIGARFFGFYHKNSSGQYVPRTDLVVGDSVEYNGDEVYTEDYQILTINCPTTGIKDLKNGVSLNVFPNPASNQISFNYDFKTATEASLRITDIAGRVVKTITLGKQNAGSKTFNVDIAGLNNGMYYIELATESTRSISKFTKN